MIIYYPVSLDTFTTKTDNVDDVQAVDINDVQDAVEALEIKVGIDSSGVDTSLDYKVNNFFVENTRIVYLYENTAPTGWSTSGLPADRVLAIKGGTQAYNISGGTQGGTWTQPSHSLVKAELPTDSLTGGLRITTSYGTSIYKYGKTDESSVTVAGDWVTGGGDAYLPKTEPMGSGTAHNHGTTYRPYAAVGILVKYVGS